MASAGCEPANLGTKGQHATSRQPKPLPLCYLNYELNFNTKPKSIRIVENYLPSVFSHVTQNTVNYLFCIIVMFSVTCSTCWDQRLCVCFVCVCVSVQYHILLCYLTSAVKFSGGARCDKKPAWFIELSSDLLCASTLNTKPL